ncbi:MAG: hypothetical protein U0R27_00700 [Candidatus Nanopelagicales bacterium]
MSTRDSPGANDQGSTAMDRPDLDLLPALIDVPTAAAVLGIGRSLAYDLVRTDRWPTPVLRVGKLIRIPTAALRRLLDPDTAAAPHGTPDHS